MLRIHVLRIPGMRSGDVCLVNACIGRANVVGVRSHDAHQPRTHTP